MNCNLLPDGWLCTREANHIGPCAAIKKTDNVFIVHTAKDIRSMRVLGVFNDIDKARTWIKETLSVKNFEWKEQFHDYWIGPEYEAIWINTVELNKGSL